MRASDRSSSASQSFTPTPSTGLDRAAQLEIVTEIARIAALDLELRPLLQRITDALRARLGCEFVACVSVDGDRRAFVCEAVSTSVPSLIQPGYSRELGSGVVGEVALTGKPIVLDDVRGVENFVDTLDGTMSEMCVPVWHRGQLVAILNAESRRLAAFNGQLPLMQIIAEQISGVIASARVLEAQRHQMALLRMVSEISKAAMEAADLTALLEGVCQYICEHFPVAMTSILLYDASRAEIELRAHAGPDRPTTPVGTRWSVTRGIVGRAVLSGAPQLVTDVSADPDYFCGVPDANAEFVVPLRLRERTLGALNVECYDAATLSAPNLLAFRTFADQIAGAVHMATVNDELEAMNDRLRVANERLAHLSATDELTGLANRRRFDEALLTELRRAGRTGSPLALLLLDIDHFKAYNDQFGHQRGDECLQRVAHVLRDSATRASDLVARYGGEEFAVLLPDTGRKEALAFAERLRARVAAEEIAHVVNDAPTMLTISIGVAVAAPHETLGAPSALLGAADQALYVAKNAGRNRVHIA